MEDFQFCRMTGICTHTSLDEVAEKKPIMNIEVIREAVRQRPFKPFTLRMNDGREFFIPHPEFVLVARRAIAVVKEPTGVIVQLEPVLIASMEFEEEKTPGNPPSGGTTNA